MGKIQVVAVNVEGDSETIKQALDMAAGVLARSALDAAPLPAPATPIIAPHPAIAAPSESRPTKRPYKKRDVGAGLKPARADDEAGLFECKRCGEQFDRKGKLSAHTRYKHGSPS